MAEQCEQCGGTGEVVAFGDFITPCDKCEGKGVLHPSDKEEPGFTAYRDLTISPNPDWINSREPYKTEESDGVD